ncbi:hypothetical protein FNU76_01780 [Chitinimonas arctica]|uniref:Uncharacterized protein n=1 Tax=Chitinimonas arctica TaxID=2594795 RepID=A0A516SAK8_9NEIS|nr:hypothetical protein [Chitinimonas arctica]QDQ25185.1 hypothetical protein FNU76_01780 [Chitinimonas arctica]
MPPFHEFNHFEPNYQPGAVIKYSFMSSLPFEYRYNGEPYERAQFAPFTAQQIAATNELLTTISKYINVTFVQTSGSDADIRLGTSVLKLVPGVPDSAVGVMDTVNDSLGFHHQNILIEPTLSGYPWSANQQFWYKAVIHEVLHALVWCT